MKNIKKIIRYVQALLEVCIYYPFRYKKDVCTHYTKRCIHRKRSKSYKKDLLGGDIPICCSSHLLELFIFVDSVFRIEKLEYFLFFGTHLGVIRHNGIVPWDTDLDLGISLRDKDQIVILLKKYINAYNLPYYVDYNTKQNAIKLYFSKVNTLHVDLFCYNCIDNKVVFYNCSYNKDYIFPLKETTFYGYKAFIPQSEKTLNIFYGDDWSIIYYKQWAFFKKKKKLSPNLLYSAPIDWNIIKITPIKNKL